PWNRAVDVWHIKCSFNAGAFARVHKLTQVSALRHARLPEIIPASMRFFMRVQDECVIGVFHSPEVAEEAVRKLESHGWSEDQISLITRGHEADLDAF